MSSNEKLNFSKRQAPIPQSHYYISGPTNIFAQAQPPASIPQKRSRPKDGIRVEDTAEYRARLSACGTSILDVEPLTSSSTKKKRARSDVDKNETNLPNKSSEFPIRVVPFGKLAAHQDSPPFDLRVVKPDETKRNSENLGIISPPHEEPKTEKTKSKVDESELERIPIEHSTSVLNSSSQDTHYQLKTLMLFLKCGIERGYSFAFPNLKDESEKFDCIAFQYKENDGTSVYRFLQAKHKKQTNGVIRMKDLFNVDGEFSLQKYFISFRKIVESPLFEGHKMKDFVVCTNYNLEESLKNYFEPVFGNDETLTLQDDRATLLRLKYNELSRKHKLVSLLKQSSECNRLAKRLAEYVIHEKLIDLKDDLFKIYHRALREHVIQVENVDESKGKNVINAKFYNSFLNEYLPDSAKKFRIAFYEACREMSKAPINENTFWQKMKVTKLKISQSFKTYFELDDNPQITYCGRLAEKIAEGISEAKDDAVKIEKRGNVMTENIHKLAGHVFVKKDTTEEDTYYFSSEFVNEKYKLPGNLGTFRNNLREELNKKKLPLDNIKYKFRIAKFNTCEEGVVHSKVYLPADDDEISEEQMKYFFNKLVFAINQPNEAELGQIIEKKLNKYFNWTENNSISNPLQAKIQDWMQTEKGRFLTHRDGEIFFGKIEKKISNLVVHDSTKKFCAELESYGIKFKNTPPELRSFLTSAEEQIFILNSSSKITRLSAIKVIQTLNTIPAFKNCKNFISMHLRSILPIQDRLIDAFDSETSNNLLVIESEAIEENDKWRLLYRLCSIIERRCNKKIILIAQENDVLAEAFEGVFSENNKCRKKKDTENSLIDTTQETQSKLLGNEKVTVQLTKAIKEELLFSLLETNASARLNARN